MKNKLKDLNDHLFAQMERLTEENLTPEKLDNEIKRSKEVSHLAQQIVSNARLGLDAAIATKEYGLAESPLLIGNDKQQ